MRIVKSAMPKLILIADDDENDSAAMRQVLHDAGVDGPVVTVTDGAEVITYLTGRSWYSDRTRFPLPKVLLLDLKMLRMGGFAVMEWMGEHGFLKDVLVIVLSGHGELENIHESYRLGARSFLTKPCKLLDVLNLVVAYPEFWDVKGATEKESETTNLKSRQQTTVIPSRRD